MNKTEYFLLALQSAYDFVRALMRRWLTGYRAIVPKWIRFIVFCGLYPFWAIPLAFGVMVIFFIAMFIDSVCQGYRWHK